ncbi:Protein IWS1 [Folsomia candida]|uniref:Protein IWS1 n=1 Tax=Folsomia candida TaxID=158441 RepID=A0A226E7J5_FOLCA|nr:Protein IWS1 [Folsomia candida]
MYQTKNKNWWGRKGEESYSLKLEKNNSRSYVCEAVPGFECTAAAHRPASYRQPPPLFLPADATSKKPCTSTSLTLRRTIIPQNVPRAGFQTTASMLTYITDHTPGHHLMRTRTRQIPLVKITKPRDSKLPPPCLHIFDFVSVSYSGIPNYRLHACICYRPHPGSSFNADPHPTDPSGQNYQAAGFQTTASMLAYVIDRTPGHHLMRTRTRQIPLVKITKPSSKMKFSKADMNKAHNNTVSFCEKEFWTAFLREERVPHELCRGFFLKMAEFREEKNPPKRRRAAQEIVSEHVPLYATTYDPHAHTEDTQAEDVPHAQTEEAQAEDVPRAQTQDTQAENAPHAQTEETQAEDVPHAQTEDTQADQVEFVHVVVLEDEPIAHDGQIFVNQADLISELGIEQRQADDAPHAHTENIQVDLVQLITTALLEHVGVAQDEQILVTQTEPVQTEHAHKDLPEESFGAQAEEHGTARRLTRRSPKPSKRYPTAEYYVPRKTRSVKESWCNCGVRGNDHLPAVECDGCGKWYHYQKDGVGKNHCDYKESNEWYCLECRDAAETDKNDSIEKDGNDDLDSENGDQNDGNDDVQKFDDDTYTEKHDGPENDANGGSEADMQNNEEDAQETSYQFDHQTGSANENETVRVHAPLADVQLDVDTVCTVLGISQEELNYIPPKKMTVIFSPNEVSKFFDYKTSKFVENKIPGDVISQKLREAGILCPFKNRREPYYYSERKKDQPFARQQGYCSCGIKFQVTFPCKPIQGEALETTLESFGVFTLVQGKRTSRPITGIEREKLSNQLSTTSAAKIFLTDLKRYALRTVKSESKGKVRLASNIFDDLRLLKNHYQTSHNANATICGYIQDFNLDAKLFRLDLFDQQSIKLFTDTISREYVIVGIDATGGILKPLPRDALYPSNDPAEKTHRNKRNTLLLYTIVAQTKQGSFIVADSVLMRGQSNDIAGPLTSIKRGVKKLRPYQTKSAPDKSYAILKNEDTFAGDTACIQLCASHLTKSFLDNVRKKTVGHKFRNEIVDASVRGLAKLQEASTLNDVEIAMKDICTLFGKEKMSPEDVQHNLARIKSISLEEWVDGDVIVDDYAGPDEEEVNASRLLREKSPFYHTFQKIRRIEEKHVNEDAELNPFYNPAVLNVFENTYAPYVGIFARGVVQQTKNANCELEFRLLKQNLIVEPENVADFVRHRFEITNDIPKGLIQEEVQECKETWSKRKKGERKNRYLHNRTELTKLDEEKARENARVQKIGRDRSSQPLQQVLTLNNQNNVARTMDGCLETRKNRQRRNKTSAEEEETTTANLESKFRKIVSDLLTDQQGNSAKQSLRKQVLGEEFVTQEKQYQRYKIVENLTEDSLMMAYSNIKEDIMEVYVANRDEFVGGFKCARQKMWVERKPNFSGNLQQMVVSYPFTTKSCSKICSTVSSDIQKLKNISALGFEDILQVTTVLLPETLELIYSDVLKTPLHQARKELSNISPFD